MSVRPTVGSYFKHVHGRGCSTHLSRVPRARCVALSWPQVAQGRCHVSAPASCSVLHAGIAVVPGVAGVHAVLPCVQRGTTLFTRGSIRGELDAISTPVDAFETVATVSLLVGVVSTEAGLRAGREVEHPSEVLEVDGVGEVDAAASVFPLARATIVRAVSCVDNSSGEWEHIQRVIKHCV